MADDVRSQMLQAYNWIKEGRKKDAEDLLIEVLGKNENNADAWWLLANALNDPQEQREALEQLLQIRPGDEKATKMLAKLEAALPKPKPKPVYEDEDPFADLLGDSKPSTSKPRASSDPFGDVSSTDDDPFAVVDAANKRRPAAAPASRSRTFYDSPIETKEEKKTNPWLIAAVVIGVLAIASCAICAFVVQRSLTSLGDQFTTAIMDPTLIAAIGDPTLQAAFQQGGSGGFSGGFAEARLPGGLDQQGALLANGQNSQGNLSGFTDVHAWIFNGDGGASYTVRVNARNDNEMDIRAAVYGPDNQIVGSNDDIDFGSNRNAQVTFTANQSGVYTIVIDAFSGNGAYTVSLSR
jgi:hypothetical protein